MEATKAKNIILVGFMGAGKTSLATKLAKAADGMWLDSDRVIEMDNKMAVSEIFREKGEAFFRDAETDFLQKLRNEEGVIVATGGGIVAREENRQLLKSAGYVVFLHASEQVLFQRVSRSRKRPLLQTADPRETIRALLALRLPWYREVADLELDSGVTSKVVMIEKVLESAGWPLLRS